MLHVLIQLLKYLSSYDSGHKLAAVHQEKRLDQTKLALVWLTRISVHARPRPLAGLLVEEPILRLVLVHPGV